MQNVCFVDLQSKMKLTQTLQGTFVNVLFVLMFFFHRYFTDGLHMALWDYLGDLCMLVAKCLQCASNLEEKQLIMRPNDPKPLACFDCNVINIFWSGLEMRKTLNIFSIEMFYK